MRKQSSSLSFDLILFGAVLFLMVTGVLFIYSSGISSTGQQTSNEYLKQIIWIVGGLGLMFLFFFINYANFKTYAIPIYLGSVLLLVVTLLLGRVVNGARSWIGLYSFGIQPSEFTKISVILVLAAYLVHVDQNIQQLRYFLGAFAIVAFPMGLVLIQPDMGTAMVYIPIFLFMTFMAGARIRHLLYVVLAGGAGIFLMMLPVWQELILQDTVPLLRILTERQLFFYTLGVSMGILVLSITGMIFFKKGYFYWMVYGLSIWIVALVFSVLGREFLKDYQMTRLIIFLDPYIDEFGAGWNIIQSVTAVGSGGFWGKGFLQGTQSHYSFLPQQSTDFIFSVLAEEWGLVGGVLVFLLFFLVLYRGIATMTYSRDSYGVYCGAGVVAMIFFHVIINVGMATGIMPVTGIPLFFLSYGGSSLWTVSIGIGILLSIYKRRYRY